MLFLKGTAREILSVPPFTEWHVRFIHKVPFLIIDHRSSIIDHWSSDGDSPIILAIKLSGEKLECTFEI